jgi:hypothetical protein
MPDASLMKGERLVDGGAEKRMDETERRLGAQDVGPCECACCLGSRLALQICQRRSLVGIGVVAEYRDGLCKPP